jgi:hypothetical protein
MQLSESKKKSKVDLLSSNKKPSSVKLERNNSNKSSKEKVGQGAEENRETKILKQFHAVHSRDPFIVTASYKRNAELNQLGPEKNKDRTRVSSLMDLSGFIFNEHHLLIQTIYWDRKNVRGASLECTETPEKLENKLKVDVCIMNKNYYY